MILICVTASVTLGNPNMRGYVKNLVGKFKDYGNQERDSLNLIEQILEPRLTEETRYNSIYDGVDYCSELLYIALSDLSIESGYESLVMNGADAPSGRQARRHWKRSEFQDWCELKEECLDETFTVFKRRGMLREKVCAAADYHDRPYYGDKNDEMVRGIEAKEGTNWGHVFLCLDIVASGRAVTLDFEPRGKLKQIPKLLGKLLEEGRKKVKMDLILLDREFYNVGYRTLIWSLFFPQKYDQGQEGERKVREGNTLQDLFLWVLDVLQILREILPISTHIEVSVSAEEEGIAPEVYE